MSATPIVQKRQAVRHFQQFKKLKDAENKPGDPKISESLCQSFAWELDYYREMDNSPDDYDPRPGHVLLPVDDHCDGPTQVRFQDNGSESSLSRLYMLEPTGGFFEEHFILADEKFHLLRVSPQDNLCFLTAYHWDKRKPDVAQQQSLMLGTPSLGGPLTQSDPPLD